MFRFELGDPDLVEAWEEKIALFRKQFKWILGVFRPLYQSECWLFTKARRQLGLGLSEN
jgi:hypothetical protein